MKRPIGKIIFLLFLLLLPLASWGQKRIYTKSYRMQDFKSKTTRVVLPGPPEFDQALRESITSLWTISPYEFCTKAQFEKQKSNPDLCFLYTETNRGIVYLTLAKGGKTNDTNPLKRPLEIISVPIAGERDSSGQELLYMPVFISIVQDYTDAAMESETAAYSGIGVITHGIPHGITIYTDPAVYTDVHSALSGAGYELVDSDIEFVPSMESTPSDKDLGKLRKLVATLEDNDDVQKVQTNSAVDLYDEE